jgi:hypothetical protein
MWLVVIILFTFGWVEMHVNTVCLPHQGLIKFVYLNEALAFQLFKSVVGHVTIYLRFETFV